MIIQNPLLTGSLSYNGVDLSNVTSSNANSASVSLILTAVSSSNQQLSASYIALSASYNVFSGSASTRITVDSASLQQVSSSQQQVSSSYIALSASYNTFSGSASTRITTISSSQQDISASLLQVSASYIALSGSYNTFSGSASTRITKIENNYATTGSNSFRADQSITGSLVVSSAITAQTLVVQTITSSILYSSGSNIFGNQITNTQTFTGSVNITGSQTIFGNVGTNYAAQSNIRSFIYDNSSTNYAFVAQQDGAGPIAQFSGNGGSSKMYISSSGNVGIGLTNPSAVLYVSGSGSGSLMRISSHVSSSIFFVSGSGNVGIGTTTFTAGNGTNLEVANSSVARVLVTQTGTRSFSLSAESNAFYLYDQTANATRLYVSASGNVGIGTTTPTSALQIYRTAYTGNQFKTYAELQAAPTTLTYSTSDGFGLILNMYEAVSGNPYTRYADIVANTGDVSDSAMRFFTKAYSTNIAERMRITPAGSVGIGLTNPSAVLHVSGSGSGSLMQISSHVSSSIFFVSGSGNIGIGTTDLGPDGLSLPASFNYTWSEGSGNAYATLFRQRNSAATVMASGYKRSNTGAFASSYGISMARAAIAVGYNNGSIAFFSDPASNVVNGTDITITEKVTITNAGNLGIGNSSPSALLHISGSGSGSLMQISSHVSSSIFFVSGSGNVGIGTSAPTYKFETLGTSVITAAFGRSDYGASNVMLIAMNGYRDVYKQAIGVVRTGDYDKGDMIFCLNGSANSTVVSASDEKMRITSGGNLGIGNTSPKTKLDVDGYFGVGSKAVTITDSYSTQLTINLSNHTGVYVKVTIHGDLSSHSAIGYMGEFFIQNGAGAYAEPGTIIREVNNTSTAIFSAKLIDPASSGTRDFTIQFKHDASATSVTGTLVYQIQGNYNSIS